MGWITEANKLGEYYKTYQGFRIYITKHGATSERIEHRQDGSYRVTEIIKPEYVAVNREGYQVQAAGLEAIGFKIDVAVINIYYDKKEAKNKQK